MGSSYLNWGSWGYVQKSSSDWNDDALADAANETSDAISLDEKECCEIGITLVEDNTGVIDGVVTVSILGACGDDGGGAVVYEDPDDGPLQFTITPVQNDTVRRHFSIDASVFSDFKIDVDNDAGQELAVTVEYKTAVRTY